MFSTSAPHITQIDKILVVRVLTYSVESLAPPPTLIPARLLIM